MLVFIYMSDIVTSTADIMNGAPVFKGTRVPIRTLFDYLEGGDNIGEFLTDFPSVSREQVVAFLDQLKDETVRMLRAA